jgi:DNA replication licensing factor MCM7
MSKYSLYSDDCQWFDLDALSLSDIYSILRVRDEAARASSMDVRYAHAPNLISRKV